jgi:hypothetical protein
MNKNIAWHVNRRLVVKDSSMTLPPLIDKSAFLNLNRSGHERTIYHTRGGNANNYSTEEVLSCVSKANSVP